MEVKLKDQLKDIWRVEEADCKDLPEEKWLFMTRVTLSFYRHHKRVEIPFFRNAHLEAEATKIGYSFPSARKTGTTICGLVFKVSVRQICGPVPVHV